MEQSHTEAYPPLTEEQRDAIRDGMRRRAEKGEITCGAPLGYKNVSFAGKKYVEVDEAIAPLIREAFRLAANRDNSLRKVLAEVTKQGLKSKHGNVLGPSALHRILTNPYYVSVITYKRALQPGLQKALVSRGLFDKVQQEMSKRSKRT